MKRLLTVGVAAVAATFATAAFAQDNMFMMGPAAWWGGPEVGIQGGYGWGNSHGHATDPGVGTLNYKFSTDGGLGGVHGGYDWQMGNFVLGLEGDIEGGDISGVRRDTTAAPTAAVSSRLDADASVRGKLGYAFGRFLVYGTGGVEFGDVTTHYAVPIATRVGSSSGIRTGWTAGGGLGYAITPNWEGNIEYRYADLGDDNTALRGAALAAGATAHNDFNYNMIRVGLTYRFAPPPPPPPPAAAPMPAAAPAPAPMPQARTFLVFFDFDRYNLTPDARRVVDAAAASYKATGSARVEVSGYTDLAGTQAYNLRLSQRRADTVARALAQQGVPRGAMDVKWFGKEHPRVPTPDGVREPQNRRVEIVMP